MIRSRGTFHNLTRSSRAAVVIAFTLNPSALFASEEFNPAGVRIVWDRDAGRKDSESIKKDGGEKLWAKLCGNLANGILVGKGPWGLGVFKDASCFIGPKLISGKSNPNDWLLKFVEGDNESTLELRNGLTNDAAVLARATYLGSKWSLQFFMDPGFVDLVSLRLLNELPMMGWMNKGELAETGARKTRSIYVPPSGARQYKVAAPPASMLVFSATAADSFIMPAVKGRADIGEFVEPSQDDMRALSDKSRNPAKATAGVPKKEFYLTWKYDRAAVEANKKQGVWFQDSRGSGQLTAELDEAIGNASSELENAIEGGLFKKFLNGLKATAASGYVGVRYGKQTLSGDPLLKKTAFFGLLAEVRGGPLEGLRYYWDKVPLVRQSTDGFETSIEYSRHIVGKSFGLNLTRFVDHMDLTPKIGMWSFNARLIDSYNDDGTAASVGTFDMARGFSFCLEAGIEWRSPRHVIRPWYSYDYANALNSVTSKKVTSSRLGLDTYWTAGPIFRLFGRPMKTAILGFFVYESLSLSSSNDNRELAEGEREIIAVTLIGGFAGAGLALSW